MATVFGKKESDFYSAFFIRDSVKRRAALDEWINSTAPVMQAAVTQELKDFVEYITNDRWTEDGWRRGVEKLRQIQNSYHIILDIQLRPIGSRGKIRGELPEPVIQKTEIDLHGNTVDEAIPLVEVLLNESYNANVHRVRIIHGKGIGVLRQAIRDYLQNHRLVKFFAPADKDHGGDGATEVDIIDVITN